MSSVHLRWLAAGLGCLHALAGIAGEIIIVEPAQGSRSERGAERAKEQARQQAGRAKADATVVIVDSPTDGQRAPSGAEQAVREAQDYLRPPAGGETAADGGTTIMLRAAPPSDAEKARLRARSYVTPNATAGGRDCRNVTATQVGVIGNTTVVGTTVVEKGTPAVNVQCK